jgi:transposase-like protein
MSKSKKRYSESEKLSLLRDYHQSGMSKTSFCKSRGLCGIVLLNKWLKKYGIEKEMLPLQAKPTDEAMANRSKDDYKDENMQLKKRIRELEKALEFSRLETLARDMMIDKAEEYFDIAIRKKSGAK